MTSARRHTAVMLTSSLMFMSMLFCYVHGHGRLLEPPSRSSMWRLGYDSPVNYQDMELFCGGVGVQYGQNDGKCGVCGDPWNGPRENEAGGKYANGIIVRKYDVGQVIDVTVELTANHKGYFEFHLCPTDNPFEKITNVCLQKFPLEVEPSGDIRYPVSDDGGYSGGKFKLRVRLPSGVTCRACLFQWKYNAGNSWGTNPDGTGCIGCGNQEQFYGCADIAIGYDDVVLGKPAVKHPWYFQETDSVWHYGVVRYINGTGSTAHTFQQKNVHSVVVLAVMNGFVVFLLALLTRS